MPLRGKEAGVEMLTEEEVMKEVKNQNKAVKKGKAKIVVEEDENLSFLKKQLVSEKSSLETVPTVQEKVADVQNRVRWIPVKSLPSEGKPYPKGTSFAYRAYTYEEISAISNADLRSYDRFSILLQGIKSIGTTEVDPKLLTFEDFRFINILRKLEAFGANEKYYVRFFCPACEEFSKGTFTLGDLEFLPMKAPKLPAKVKFEGLPEEVFEFMPTTIGDILWLQKNEVWFLRDSQGEYLVDANDRYIIDTVAVAARQCVNVDFSEAYEKFRSLTLPSDMRLFREVDDVMFHGIRPFTVKCTTVQRHPLPDNYEEMTPQEKQRADLESRVKSRTCGEPVTIDVAREDTIFLPFHEHEQPAASGIFFD